ncbi:CTP-dependent riboflavin kinase [Candidatus Woesearchaeota archaeon]|nr:CTP-dependent riboflavin kinase [Candidatus Woesearchaeota archaeon]
MPMYEYLELINYTAKKAGLFGTMKSSTLKISKDIGISQQTISRKLKEMEGKGLIKRATTPKGITVGLDTKGREFLEENFRTLNSIFEPKRTAISGLVEKGIGEGSYYLSQKQYQKQIKNKFGFDAFPGTLNAQVDEEDIIPFLAKKRPVQIEGFTTKTRTFGPLTAYEIRIGKIKGAIIRPERARHPEGVIEIAAPVNLRQSLNLKDGDRIRLY